MLKKQKAIIIACICMLILPLRGSALDKEEFLKFIVNSSYPEVKEKDDDTEQIEEIEKTDEVEDNGENKEKESISDEEDFFKVYVGEENIPEETKVSTGLNATTSQYMSQYTNNIKLTGDKPSMFIYHTHAGETYLDSPTGNYHSQGNEDKSVLSVGMMLTGYLDNMGWNVIHNIKYNDYPDFNKSYVSSLDLIKSTISKYDSIDVAIDLHRDGVLESKIPEEKDRMTTTINGEEVAKFFLVVGQGNPNVNEIDKIAKGVVELAEKMYPGIVAPIVYKPNSKFNQYLVKNQMLIEVGSNGTTSEQAQNTTKYLAEILDEYFKEHK